MSIQTEIERLKQAKSDLKTAIEDKGVVVNENKKINEYGALVNSIVELKGQEKTIAPTTSQQVITPDSSYNGITSATVSAVTNEIDSNIVASNIKSGIEILGVTGILKEGVTPEETIASGNYGTDNATGVIKDGDLGFKAQGAQKTKLTLFEKGAMMEIKMTNEQIAAAIGLTAEKIKKGEIILGITGTYEGEAPVV